MKIPFNHIKEEVKRIDKHNEKQEKKIEKQQESDRQSVATEISSAAASKGFRKDMEYGKRHPGHLKKVLRKMYGDKVIPH